MWILILKLDMRTPGGGPGALSWPWGMTPRKKEEAGGICITEGTDECLHTGAGVGVGMLRGSGESPTWKVYWFLGFLVSWLSVFWCWCSWFWFLVVVRFLGFLVYWFRSFQVQRFRISRIQNYLYCFRKSFIPYYQKCPFHVFKKLWLPCSKFSGISRTDLHCFRCPPFTKFSKIMMFEILRSLKIIYL